MLSSKVFLARAESMPGNSTKWIKSLWQLALLYTENARTDSARAIIHVVERFFDSNPNKRSQKLFLQTLSISATLDLMIGSAASARDKWRQVYQTILQQYGPATPDAQIEGTNLAIAMKRLGQTKEACALLEQVERDVVQSHPEDVWTLEYARIARHTCNLEIEPAQDAKDDRLALKHSWEILAYRYGPENFDALSALGSYALATLRVGNASEAKALLSQLVQYAESARVAASAGSMSRTYQFSHWISAGSDLINPIAGYRQLALLFANDAELESALRTSELARDRTLGDIFAEQQWRRERLPAEARKALEDVLDRIQALDERIAVATDIVERVRLEAERTLAVAERSTLEREDRARFGVGEPVASPPTLDDLRDRLARDTALVSVLHSGSTWWALVIRRDEPARFIVFPDTDLGVAASAWARRLRGQPVRVWPLASRRLVASDTAPEGASAGYLADDELALRASRALMVPLVRALNGARHIVFVADDELVGVPLQALPLGPGLVLDRFEISYAPSLSTYARWQVPGRAHVYARDVLAVGAVDVPRLEPPETDDPIVAGVLYAADHPLRHAREEIEGIAARFPPGRVTVWTGAAASKAALHEASNSGALAGYRYVHFATHAWARPEQPEGSAIVMGGPQGALPTQFALTAAELAGLHMDSSLVVLSACDTGSGHFEHGRGLLGLAYAGLAAGNRAELLTLWPIADDTSAQFMQRFYRRLRGGRGPSQALAETQREFRHSPDPRRSNARAWAPFVLYGGY